MFLVLLLIPQIIIINVVLIRPLLRNFPIVVPITIIRPKPIPKHYRGCRNNRIASL